MNKITTDFTGRPKSLMIGAVLEDIAISAGLINSVTEKDEDVYINLFSIASGVLALSEFLEDTELSDKAKEAAGRVLKEILEKYGEDEDE